MKLILIRGLPGSGKSTLAKQYIRQGFTHFETDMYFQHFIFGYLFDPSKLSEAHDWCQINVWSELRKGNSVVVSNTFTQHWEMAPYIAMANEFGADIEIITATGNYKNVHNVPDYVIDRMRERWED